MNLITKEFLHEIFPKNEYSINALISPSVGEQLDIFQSGDIFCGSITMAHTFRASFNNTPVLVTPRFRSALDYYIASSNHNTIVLFNNVIEAIDTVFIGYRITKK